MTEAEMKEMLKDIIDNGSEYEYRFKCSDEWSSWTKYELGEAINLNTQRWEYRKVDKAYVIQDYNGNYTWTIDKRIKKFDTVFFEGTKEECEKWVSEHTKKTWLKGYIEDKAMLEDKAMAYMMSKDICKKILGELKVKGPLYIGKNWLLEDITKIIKDLGVEV